MKTQNIIKHIEKKKLDSLDLISPKNGNKWSVDYAITLTLKPILYKHTCEEQFSIVATSIRNNFPNCKFTLLAELTKQYNVHFHGIIKVDLNKIVCHPEKYLYDRIRQYKHLGFAVIKQITEYQIWIDYITKDYNITKQKANIDPFVKDDYDIHITLGEGQEETG